ncbi:hypothetical protein E2C01_076104 [Portunus trituberculatus]|uniref:Uncharacterized protein n=1 Tax=Portunus trituberculatus TaxID=210409 RepID=A0A5B7IIX9_PORTR|nr:hypothetical protein [Portunus trituberculatus]
MTWCCRMLQHCAARKMLLQQCDTPCWLVCDITTCNVACNCSAVTTLHSATQGASEPDYSDSDYEEETEKSEDSSCEDLENDSEDPPVFSEQRKTEIMVMENRLQTSY